MSQFYVTQMGGSGPLPPTVPTQFTTDYDSAGNPDGVVIPANNNVNVLGNPLVPDTQGIVTQAITTTFPDDTIYIRYKDGFATTVGDSSATPLLFSIPDDSSYTIQAVVTGFCAATGDNFGGRLLVVGDNIAGVARITTVIENISSGTNLLADCSVNFIAVANGLAVTVTGVATGVPPDEIQWHVLLPVIAIS